MESRTISMRTADKAFLVFKMLRNVNAENKG